MTSIQALLTALANNAVSDIVVANGTYHVSGAASQASDSLWIGSRFAGRTNPVTVRAETKWGVTFDGGGETYFGGLSFEEGVHDQTWDGFRFANGQPTQTGVVLFGGYAGLAAPYRITLLNLYFSGSIISPETTATDAAVYWSTGAGHDHLVDGLTVDGSGGLASAIQLYHSQTGYPNAYNVTIRHMTVTGTDQAVIVWNSTIYNIVIEDSTITGAKTAVRYEQGGTLTLRRVTSTNSSQIGFYSSLGSTPPSVTFIDSLLR